MNDDRMDDEREEWIERNRVKKKRREREREKRREKEMEREKRSERNGDRETEREKWGVRLQIRWQVITKPKPKQYYDIRYAQGAPEAVPLH
ncbi:hypothetical protein BOTBODRAFT_36809 [Botryobasidium botryosum FD-172 SS1]|uniref:Uncharacterized protein n=1 Tax=Botryobasidium botryosum (strain FD-172 SS1) TaxID=930990 RepID=A0A067MCV1_BOTB1|nr:hypothetical protein BOTBODRAFT_36809 [Botryobasidium botryosum FD-172 SS1]